jgi:hypothetical protein
MGGLWFSVARQVQARDLSPKLDEVEGKDYISALGIILMPPAPNSAQPWFSLVQPLSATGVDLSEAQYIDIWINDFNRFHGENAAAGLGKELRIDLGRVSEDAVWDPRRRPLRPTTASTSRIRTTMETAPCSKTWGSTAWTRPLRTARASVPREPFHIPEFKGEPIQPREEVLRASGEQTDEDFKIATARTRPATTTVHGHFGGLLGDIRTWPSGSAT